MRKSREHVAFADALLRLRNAVPTGLLLPYDLGVVVEECVLCEIVAGRAEASFVHADDAVVAIMDLRPVTPGHVLVIPREHRPLLPDVGVR